MRREEQIEVWAHSHCSPELAVARSLEACSAPIAAVVNGETMGVFGVNPVSLLLGQGIPWLLTTPAVDRYPLTFMRLCRWLLPDYRRRWPVLMNFIHAKHTRSIAWARRLGFTVFDPSPMGVDGEDFCRIELRG
jgi:hypothetical protein